jgi:preprotein translocase subunit YajC
VPTSLMVLHHAQLLAASTGTSKKGGGGQFFLLILIGAFAIFYVAVLRPRRNQQRAAITAKRQPKVGDEVTTTAGLIANVVAVEDDYLTLEVAPGVLSRYVPAAILQVNGPDEPEEPVVDASNHEVIDDAADDSTDTPDSPTAS